MEKGSSYPEEQPPPPQYSLPSPGKL